MKNNFDKIIFVTGGAGFIGSNLLRHLVLKYPNYQFFNIDKLTYAGNLQNLKFIEGSENYQFIKQDINNSREVLELFREFEPDGVFHLAAESHVDRSITNPLEFLHTNILGTAAILEGVRQSKKSIRLLHISTDEVFGSLGESGFFTEETSYDPNSPYSASKASSDHLVRAYGETYGIDYVITNCSNNYGPFQFPEKLIPLCILNIINEKKIPIYGDGKYTRDWLYVVDHVEALDKVYHESSSKNTYNIGGWNEYTNIDLVKILCKTIDSKLSKVDVSSEKLITFIKDRPGHDKRYAIDASKINNDLGWKPRFSFNIGIELTIDWYLNNPEWLKNISNQEYLDYYNNQYKK